MLLIICATVYMLGMGVVVFGGAAIRDRGLGLQGINDGLLLMLGMIWPTLPFSWAFDTAMSCLVGRLAVRRVR